MMTAAGPARTPLFDWHTTHGGRMVDFAGWTMPVQYTSIVAEHEATRTAVGLFDISHMGRLEIDGPAAMTWLDSVVTRRVVGMKPGQIRYSLITNHEGGILDDVLIYCQLDTDGPPIRMVVNAGNRGKIVAWLTAQRQRYLESGRPETDVEIRDVTTATAMIAVQGPKVVGMMAGLLSVQLGDMRYYTGTAAEVAGRPALVSRTGYTGEDGCELIVPAEAAVEIWEAVLAAGRGAGTVPAGLGCRDTLRLEAAMPLYGHELTEQVNPVQAGLMFAVNLKDRDFPGREAIARFQADQNQPKRIGLEVSGRRVPRQGAPIMVAGQAVGEVTSGTFSPTFKRPLAMGYVPPEFATAEAGVAVDIRGHVAPATIVPLPFYKRKT